VCVCGFYTYYKYISLGEESVRFNSEPQQRNDPSYYNQKEPPRQQSNRRVCCIIQILFQSFIFV